jgi:hypothetical protein
MIRAIFIFLALIEVISGAYISFQGFEPSRRLSVAFLYQLDTRLLDRVHVPKFNNLQAPNSIRKARTFNWMARLSNFEGNPSAAKAGTARFRWNFDNT